MRNCSGRQLACCAARALQGLRSSRRFDLQAQTDCVWILDIRILFAGLNRMPCVAPGLAIFWSAQSRAKLQNLGLTGSTVYRVCALPTKHFFRGTQSNSAPVEVVPSFR